MRAPPGLFGLVGGASRCRFEPAHVLFGGKNACAVHGPRTGGERVCGAGRVPPRHSRQDLEFGV